MEEGFPPSEVVVAGEEMDFFPEERTEDVVEVVDLGAELFVVVDAVDPDSFLIVVAVVVVEMDNGGLELLISVAMVGSTSIDTGSECFSSEEDGIVSLSFFEWIEVEVDGSVTVAVVVEGVDVGTSSVVSFVSSVAGGFSLVGVVEDIL